MTAQPVPVCPQVEQHTPAPVDPRDYTSWHAWAQEMGKTHIQTMCHGCGMWDIWVPRETTDG